MHKYACHTRDRRTLHSREAQPSATWDTGRRITQLSATPLWPQTFLNRSHGDNTKCNNPWSTLV